MDQHINMLESKGDYEELPLDKSLMEVEKWRKLSENEMEKLKSIQMAYYDGDSVNLDMQNSEIDGKEIPIMPEGLNNLNDERACGREPNMMSKFNMKNEAKLLNRPLSRQKGTITSIKNSKLSPKEKKNVRAVEGKKTELLKKCYEILAKSSKSSCRHIAKLIGEEIELDAKWEDCAGRAKTTSGTESNTAGEMKETPSILVVDDENGSYQGRKSQKPEVRGEIPESISYIQVLSTSGISASHRTAPHGVTDRQVLSETPSEELSPRYNKEVLSKDSDGMIAESSKPVDPVHTVIDSLSQVSISTQSPKQRKGNMRKALSLYNNYEPWSSDTRRCIDGISPSSLEASCQKAAETLGSIVCLNDTTVSLNKLSGAQKGSHCEMELGASSNGDITDAETAAKCMLRTGSLDDSPCHPRPEISDDPSSAFFLQGVKVDQAEFYGDYVDGVYITSRNNGEVGSLPNNGLGTSGLSDDSNQEESDKVIDGRQTYIAQRKMETSFKMSGHNDYECFEILSKKCSSMHILKSDNYGKDYHYSQKNLQGIAGQPRKERAADEVDFTIGNILDDIDKSEEDLFVDSVCINENNLYCTKIIAVNDTTVELDREALRGEESTLESCEKECHDKAKVQPADNVSATKTDQSPLKTSSPNNTCDSVDEDVLSLYASSWAELDIEMEKENRENDQQKRSDQNDLTDESHGKEKDRGINRRTYEMSSRGEVDQNRIAVSSQRGENMESSRENCMSLINCLHDLILVEEKEYNSGNDMQKKSMCANERIYLEEEREFVERAFPLPDLEPRRSSPQSQKRKNSMPIPKPKFPVTSKCCLNFIHQGVCCKRACRYHHEMSLELENYLSLLILHYTTHQQEHKAWRLIDNHTANSQQAPLLAVSLLVPLARYIMEVERHHEAFNVEVPSHLTCTLDVAKVQILCETHRGYDAYKLLLSCICNAIPRYLEVLIGIFVRYCENHPEFMATSPWEKVLLWKYEKPETLSEERMKDILDMGWLKVLMEYNDVRRVCGAYSCLCSAISFPSKTFTHLTCSVINFFIERGERKTSFWVLEKVKRLKANDADIFIALVPTDKESAMSVLPELAELGQLVCELRVLLPTCTWELLSTLMMTYGNMALGIDLLICAMKMKCFEPEVNVLESILRECSRGYPALLYSTFNLVCAMSAESLTKLKPSLHRLLNQLACGPLRAQQVKYKIIRHCQTHDIDLSHTERIPHTVSDIRRYQGVSNSQHNFTENDNARSVSSTHLNKANIGCQDQHMPSTVFGYQYRDSATSGSCSELDYHPTLNLGNDYRSNLTNRGEYRQSSEKGECFEKTQECTMPYDSQSSVYSQTRKGLPIQDSSFNSATSAHLSISEEPMVSDSGYHDDTYEKAVGTVFKHDSIPCFPQKTRGDLKSLNRTHSDSYSDSHKRAKYINNSMSGVHNSPSRPQGNCVPFCNVKQKRQSYLPYQPNYVVDKDGMLPNEIICTEANLDQVDEVMQTKPHSKIQKRVYPKAFPRKWKRINPNRCLKIIMTNRKEESLPKMHQYISIKKRKSSHLTEDTDEPSNRSCFLPEITQGCIIQRKPQDITKRPQSANLPVWESTNSSSFEYFTVNPEVTHPVSPVSVKSKTRPYQQSLRNYDPRNARRARGSDIYGQSGPYRTYRNYELKSRNYPAMNFDSGSIAQGQPPQISGKMPPQLGGNVGGDGNVRRTHEDHEESATMRSDTTGIHYLADVTVQASLNGLSDGGIFYFNERRGVLGNKGGRNKRLGSGVTKKVNRKRFKPKKGSKRPFLHCNLSTFGAPGDQCNKSSNGCNTTRPLHVYT